MTTAVVMIALQVAGKATRDAYFLSVFPASYLPRVMVVASGVAFAVVLLTGWAMTRFSPRRVVPAIFGLHALLFIIEWAVDAVAPTWAAVLLYLHTAGLGVVSISSFWSLINERFDPHRAKQMIGRIAGGAAFGGIVGGVAVWLLAGSLELPSMFFVLATLSALCGAGAASFGGGTVRAVAVSKDASVSPVTILKKVPYLRNLGLLVGCVALAGAIVDYIFKARAAETLASPDGLLSFFAVFHMVAGVLTFGLQTSLTRRVLAWLGLSGTVALLPLSVLGGGLLALLLPLLWTAVLLQGLSTVAENSFFRSGYELLYTPLPPQQTRPTKTAIDVGCDRVGGMLGGGVALVVLALVPAFSESVLLIVAVLAAVASLVVTRMLHRGYVAALAQSLRSGAIDLDPRMAVDATTKTIADTMALDRETLLAQIEAFKSRPSSLPPNAPASPIQTSLAQRGLAERNPPPPRASGVDPILRASAALSQKRRSEVLQVYLEHNPLELPLVPYAIQLLGHDDEETLPATVAALRAVSGRVTGQLVDALLDPASSFALRRRLPRVLRATPSQRAMDGLLLGLDDARFEVRYRCAVALVRLKRKEPSLAVPRPRVLEVAQRELSVSAQVWNSRKLLDGSDGEEDEAQLFCYRKAERELGRSLQHVFSVLSLALDPEPLQLAFYALSSHDEGLRGTGLEYLDNVLPAPIRKALSPLLDDTRLVRRGVRPLAEVAEDLLTSMDTRGIDVDALRQKGRAGEGGR